MDKFDWKNGIIFFLICALLLTGYCWFTRERLIHNPSPKYDEYTSDQLSWIIEGRKEALVDDWERLIEAVIRQKQLLSE